MDSIKPGKFANLPDVDYDQPDVYESEGIPFSEPEPTVETSSIPALDMDNIDIKQAKAFFGVADQKELDKSNLALQYRNALFKSYMLERIRDEESQISVNSKPSGGNMSGTKDQLDTNPFLEESVNEKLRRLNETKASQNTIFLNAVSDLSRKLNTLSEKTLSNNTLLLGPVSENIWEKYQQSTKQKDPSESVTNKSNDNSNYINNRDNPASVISEFEQRISKLENTVGSPTQVKSANTSISSLVSVVDDLNTKVHLLSDPVFQDSAIKKVKFLLLELKNAKSSADNLLNPSLPLDNENTRNNQSGESGHLENSTTNSVANNEKINQIYDRLHELDPVFNLLPGVISRLEQLNSLHTKALAVTESFNNAKSSLDENCSRVDQLSKVLETCQSSISENSSIMLENIKAIESKILDISQMSK
ncbi:hypothetical protein BB560_007041 [Smittium megazygosporum]|uniref:Dynactin subunit 2 n=1 Tax=Smittium megazygosporum TaxID=133381 RepID=A0A2T9XZ85_9FUNG|nr:hypothetical protein BB560_007041 [Smittium megazygosporum]